MIDLRNLAQIAQSGESLLKLWKACSKVPGGKLLFSKAVGRMAPYTGTVGARVKELEPGYARLEMRDRRAVRNHLKSIHAAALFNLAEETTGLAIMSGLPAGARGIPREIHIEYLKKARGTLTAECRCEVPERVDERRSWDIVGEIRNPDGELVTRATATWLIGPARASERSETTAKAA